MGPADTKADLTLLSRLMAGDRKAAASFLDWASGPIWTAVSALEGSGPAGEAAFNLVIEQLCADGFRRLRLFDGRSTLSTFLVLQCRDILLAQVSRAFAETPRQAWQRFERFFGPDIRRRIKRRFPRADAAACEDLYQDICVILIDNDYKRIRAYDGQGSFAGFIGVSVERMLIDLIRREAPRRRLPAEIERLPSLEQQVFMAIAWRGLPADAARLAEALQTREPEAKDHAAVARAIERVTASVHKVRSGQGMSETVSIEGAAERGAPLSLVHEGPSPEQSLQDSEEERARSELVSAIKDAAERRPAEERLYLQLVFSATDPLPPREIAKLMGRPVEDVRQIQQRVQRWVGDLARKKMQSVA